MPEQLVPMICQKCESGRILSMISICYKEFFVDINGHKYEGHVLDGIGIGGGDYVRFDYCLECGQIQGEFPLAKTDFEEGKLPGPNGVLPPAPALDSNFLKSLIG